MHAALVDLAMLATRVGRHEAARRLVAHTEAFPHFQANTNFIWVRADTLAALAAAGVPTPVPAQELSRRELFAILAEMDALS